MHIHSHILPLLGVKPPRLQLAGTLFCSSLFLLIPFDSAGSRLQDRLELSSHADIVLLLADDTLDGGRKATGVPGKDKGVAVLTAAVFFQGTAGVGDGVVVVVCVNHPVVVAWVIERRSVRRNEGIKEIYGRVQVCRTNLHWTGSWPVLGSSWTSCRVWKGQVQSTVQPCQHTQPRSCETVIQTQICLILYFTLSLNKALAHCMLI